MSHNNQFTDKYDLKFVEYKSGFYKIYRAYPSINNKGYEYIVQMNKGLEKYDGEFDSGYETSTSIIGFTRNDAIKYAKELIKEIEEENNV